ncbi:ATP-binding cassette domain-containing protein [bacterium]|nr:ATP-binding cassette domain-containing protein [FCB group bacterium]MBL7191665.1 ATP-binding cassette domain-containing protein [bacterium]
MIQIKNLTKNFGTTRAVDDISFEIKRSEILGFLGPNGAGKTTTVRVITCFLAPTSGTVEINGLNVFDNALEIRRKIGYLPENTPLYHDMNVVDFLRYSAELRKIPIDKRSMRIKKMIDVCGLGDVLHKDIGQLSKGYNQRVGLAQAMIHDPEIVILDEPTSGLDPNQIVEIRNMIKELGKEKTVVLCTHILPEVQSTCDRALIINKGKIAAHGTIEEISASQTGGDRIHLELQAAEGDPITVLKAVEGVEEVAVVPGAGVTKRYRLGTVKGSDPREKIFRTIVDNNWTLLEMRRDRTSLEEVFRLLTTN